MLSPLGMIISRMLMCEVLTIETNCCGWGLNAEYEFNTLPHELLVACSQRCGRAGLQRTVMVEDSFSDFPDLHCAYGKKFIKPTRGQGLVPKCVFFFNRVNTQIHCQTRGESWHPWGTLLMNRTQVLATCKWQKTPLSASIIFSPHWARQNNDKSFAAVL